MNSALAKTLASAWLCMFILACESDVNRTLTPASAVTIYSAQQIHTMNRAQPHAEALAVKDGLIAGVGTVESLQEAFPGAAHSRQFDQQVLVPGLIDPHMHVLLGAVMYALPFATPWPMAMPNGESQGYPDRPAFLQRLAEIVDAAEAGTAPVFVYGYHNLVQGNLSRADLDAITAERPLFVWHYSGHDFYLNSRALELAALTPALHKRYEGIGLTASGELSGRIYEDAVLPLMASIGPYLFNAATVKRGAGRYFEIIRRAGITTTAELAYGAFDRPLEDQVIAGNWSLKDSGFRLYLVPEYRAFAKEFGTEAPATVQRMAAAEIATPAPVLPRVKFFTDAAFYSQTMRLSPPGYLSGQSQHTEGLWVMKPDEIVPTIQPFWNAGLAVHIHSNGDAAQTATLAALKILRASDASRDFVIEHGGLFSPAHVVSAADLHAMVSAASHYVFYMADLYTQPLGQPRAAWITPLGALSAAGVVVTMHSDAPLAPPLPLRAAGVHITRATRTGGVYEAGQALTPGDALEAITLDAARVLGLEQQIGSLEVGKKADIAVLLQDPLSVPGQEWAGIGVWGTMLSGVIQPR